MKYVLTNNKNFLGTNSSGQLKAVSQENDALKFNTYERASNALRNIPRTLKNLGYEIKETEYGLNIHNSPPTQTFSLQETINSIEDAVSHLKSFEQWFMSIKNNEKLYEAQLELANRKQRDIEHAIEFYSLNACEGYKMYKKLKEVRCERRAYKDKLEIIKRVNECLSPMFYTMLPSERVGTLLDRKYSPRELTDLFEKVLDN